MIVTITSTPMTLNCQKCTTRLVHFCLVFRHVMMMFWSNSNKLKLNTDKNEVMPVGYAYRLNPPGGWVRRQAQFGVAVAESIVIC